MIKTIFGLETEREKVRAGRRKIWDVELCVSPNTIKVKTPGRMS
jgi:hypothetical protein